MSDQDLDAESDENTPKTIPLRISGVKHVEQEGGVTVTGTVTNDGLFDLEKTTVIGVAIDVDQNNLGQGSVGLASLLSQGASRDFSLIIPVTGEIDAVRVSATATEIVPERPTSEGSDRSSESRDEPSNSQASEDATFGNNAG